MAVNAEDPIESAPASPLRASPPSRRMAMALTLFFGPGVGHTFLGVARRGLWWALLPPLAGLVLCASVIRAGSGYGFIVPGLLLIVFLRFGALVDVFVVPEVRLRRTSLLWVALFWAASIIGSVALALLIRMHIVQAFKIPGGGMQPTLLVGDHVFVAMDAGFRRDPPKRGDLAVFAHPEHPEQDYVKRVIALPGDRLEVREGHPLLNGWPVPHCAVRKNVTLPASQVADFELASRGDLELEYLGEQSYLVFIDDRFMGGEQTWTVASNELFVLGDNRNNSADSRIWFQGRGGGVPFENLIGRPLFVWLAFRADGSVDWPRLNLRLAEPHLPPSLAALEPALRACLRSKPAQTEPPSAPH